MHGENGHELLTDLYQLTMAQGYWETGQGATQACFHAYFRDYPFRGGYAIACGMDQLAELIDGFAFSAEDVDYLASLDAPGGGRLFKPAFLEYLLTFSLRVDVDAVAEGAVVFPHEPIVRVMGPIMDCQLHRDGASELRELRNAHRHQGRSRVPGGRMGCPLPSSACAAPREPVAACGQAAPPWSAAARPRPTCLRAKSTTCRCRAPMRTRGSCRFPSELEAFRAYAREFPRNCVLLVDTYNVEQGIRNAITVGLEMRARGERLAGIRIDSGDLAWLAKMARRMLDEAGSDDCGIVLSNDLDEYTIQSILRRRRSR